MRDEDRILREVEEIARQTRRDARVEIEQRRAAVQEKELGLVRLSGEPAIIDAVRDARYSMMQDLSRQWSYLYRHDRWGRWIALKPGLLGDIARLLKKLKKKRNAQFWFQYRDSEPNEMFLSELFHLKPFAGDSPMMMEARKTRYRTLQKLLDQELITKDDVIPVYKRLDWLPLAFDWDWFETWSLADERLKMRAENKNYKAIKKITKTLSLQSPQFWFAHKDFEIQELVERHFPDAQNRSKRASALWRFAIYLAISAVFWNWTVQLFSGGAWGFCCLMPPSTLCALTMLGFSLRNLSFVKRNRGGRWLSGKSKEW